MPAPSLSTLPTDMQLMALHTFLDDACGLKCMVRRVTTLRLVSSGLSKIMFSILCNSTLCVEIERREVLLKNITHPLLQVNTTLAVRARDVIVKSLFAIMATGTSGQSAFKGLKMLATLHASEEKWYAKCLKHLETNESLDGLTPDLEH